MDIQIIELNKKLIEEYDVKKYIFKMIKDSYNLDYVPEYHYDVMNLYKYYIKPEKNNFYLAINEKNELIGTAGIRCYDKNYDIKNRTYTKDTTASIYRVFVSPEYRHNKIATRMLKKIEEFCLKQNFNEIYLHTQKDSYGALSFWLHQNYVIVHDTHDKLGTIHMEKAIRQNHIMNTTIKQKIKLLE